MSKMTKVQQQSSLSSPPKLDMMSFKPDLGLVNHKKSQEKEKAKAVNKKKPTPAEVQEKKKKMDEVLGFLKIFGKTGGPQGSAGSMMTAQPSGSKALTVGSLEVPQTSTTPVRNKTPRDRRPGGNALSAAFALRATNDSPTSSPGKQGGGSSGNAENEEPAVVSPKVATLERRLQAPGTSPAIKTEIRNFLMGLNTKGPSPSSMTTTPEFILARFDIKEAQQAEKELAPVVDVRKQKPPTAEEKAAAEKIEQLTADFNPSIGLRPNIFIPERAKKLSDHKSKAEKAEEMKKIVAMLNGSGGGFPGGSR